MELPVYFLGSYKDGQFDKRNELKEKSESGQIFTVYEDVTTYIYELPTWYDSDNQKDKDELLSAIIQGFENDLYGQNGLKGSFDIVDNKLSFRVECAEMEDYTIVDEDGDEFFYQYIPKEDESDWLYHNGFIEYVAGNIETDLDKDYKNQFLEKVDRISLIRQVEDLLKKDTVVLDDIASIKYDGDELKEFKKSDLKFDLIEKMEYLTFDDDKVRAKEHFLEEVKLEYENSDFEKYLVLKEKIQSCDFDKFWVSENNLLTDCFDFVWNRAEANEVLLADHASSEEIAELLSPKDESLDLNT